MKAILMGLGLVAATMLLVGWQAVRSSSLESMETAFSEWMVEHGKHYPAEVSEKSYLGKNLSASRIQPQQRLCERAQQPVSSGSIFLHDES